MESKPGTDIAEELYTANILKLLEIVSRKADTEATRNMTVKLTAMASSRILKRGGGAGGAGSDGSGSDEE